MYGRLMTIQWNVVMECLYIGEGPTKFVVNLVK
jgi:hypothetical protein